MVRVHVNRDVRGKPIDILFVEDNPGDVRLTEEAFEEARIRNDLCAVGRGDEALDYLHGQGDYDDPTRLDIVLLGLNLPGTSGIEVLEEIKDTPGSKRIPVIVLTGSRTRKTSSRDTRSTRTRT